MQNMEFTIQTNEGEYDLSAQVRLIGADILVAIWGGEKPHIGAVAAAQSHTKVEGAESYELHSVCFLLYRA